MPRPRKLSFSSLMHYLQEQVLRAVLVHPEHKVVIPFASEPIVKGDGATKNDCERNASKSKRKSRATLCVI